MKKTLSVLLAAIMLIGMLASIAMAADIVPAFTEKFFPDGKANAPTDVYYEIKKNDDGEAYYVYVWLTQPDDVLSMFNEWEYLGEEKFVETYGCTLEGNSLQVDCKVDDGSWHYMPEWDINEYPQEDQPYDLTIRQRITASTEQKTYREGGALIDPWYGQNDEDAGYLKPVIYTKNDNWFLDLEKHALTLRLRYIITVRNDNMTEEELDANGGESRSFVLSDWSDEIRIGKNATQADLVYPEKLEAPVISDLTFLESVEREDGNDDTWWKVFVDYPKSIGDAQKYYSISMDYSEPICAVLQYRVKTAGEWGEWKDTDWGNPTWLMSGWKDFMTEEVSKDDTIEFRAYLKNAAEEDKDSPYSESLFCNAGDATQEKPDPEETAEGTGDITGGTAEKTKCKVCGICPFQPLGICLFIWIAVILIVVILVVIISSKGKKKDKKAK